MPSLRTIALPLAVGALAAGTPIFAQGGQAVGDDPCAGNTVSTCGSSDGSGGSSFTNENIPSPTEDRRGVFITQVGATSRAEVNQTGNNSFARIAQSGDGNQAAINQEDGNHYAVVAQNGDENTARVGQEASGRTVTMLAQQGDNNVADISQSENGSLYSAVVASQTGSNNLLNLVQDGSDNQATLNQKGDGNTMTATQLGANNRLEWTQQGNGLSDLQITQEGGQAMQITQTNTGGSPGGN